VDNLPRRLGMGHSRRMVASPAPRERYSGGRDCCVQREPASAARGTDLSAAPSGAGAWGSFTFDSVSSTATSSDDAVVARFPD
jgi:hypothetical protein